MTQPRASVVLASRCEPTYSDRSDVLPELPGVRVTTAMVALRALLVEAGLDAGRRGTPEWNPFGDIVSPGMRVVLKPNWVLHENQNPAGASWECLVTHPSLIAAVLAYLVKVPDIHIVVGDSPVQGCDWDALHQTMGTDAWLAPYRDRISVRDFRLVILEDKVLAHSSAVRSEAADYVRVDLGSESMLEPLMARPPRFRVTMYDYRRLQETHTTGRHQFLVARELLEADVVINLPKLKTHKKSGVTGALKNLVGINGHKAFLPHHRLGGGGGQGDCYPGRSWLKYAAERSMDLGNTIAPQPTKRALQLSAAALVRLAELGRPRVGVEGSWFGNDTVWRMSLDLQRLLRWAGTDGRLHDTPQRRVISITDAIIGGDGDGPLAPDAKPLGLLTWSDDPATAEWVHAMAMWLDPRRIPICAHAFDRVPHPVSDAAPADIRVQLGGELMEPMEFARRHGTPFEPSIGWLGHCELEELRAAAVAVGP